MRRKSHDESPRMLRVGSGRVNDDCDAQVRVEALHTLACDRCKANACHPDPAVVLGPAIRILLADAHLHVRQYACEVVGKWAHAHPTAVEALVEATTNDGDPSVRKKADWYVHGGTIYEKTKPRDRARRPLGALDRT